MKPRIPRVRMFAGPNGSGKSTIKSQIGQELLGIYINPDEMEADMKSQGFLDLQSYGVDTTKDEVLGFFNNSSLANQFSEQNTIFREGKVILGEMKIDSYLASIAADFIRTKLLNLGKSFTFETVMSHPSKVEVLQAAQTRGYRTYLYFIATEDPEINISRVQHRIKMGGHPVAKDKIVDRYKRSLELLIQAIQFSNRAYIFDNSREMPIWLAEVTEGKILEIKSEQIPSWFKKSLLDKLRK